MDSYIRNEADESEFNAAIATLYRIDELKKFLALATVNEDQLMHFKYLRAYYKELESSMNKEDKQRQYTNYTELSSKYMYRKQCIMNKRKVAPNISPELDKWELELRNLEQKYGLNLPKKKDARWAMARR